MRRAVSEQINALKELSEIVAKSGRTFDVSERSATRPSRPAPSQASYEASRAPGAAGGAPAFVRERTAQAAAPSPRPAPQEERRAVERETAEAPSGGWVRDLLRGASREEASAPPAETAQRAAGQARSPLHVVESLNSLSVDIARAIDHEASVELWDRYRRGERNAFTRRLYTLRASRPSMKSAANISRTASSAPPSTAIATISRSCSTMSGAATGITS
jgi:hypothetical protein